MQNVSRLRILLPTLAAVFALAALTYGLVTPKQFEVSASILVRRTAIEPIEGAGEAGKNRWVWVRDGLALKEELSSDATLMEIVRDVPDLSARKDSFKATGTAASTAETAADQEVLFLETLRKEIKVLFNGADESVYEITVRDANPKVARQVVEALTLQLKRLVIDEAAAARHEGIAALAQQVVASEDAPGSKFVAATGASHAKDRLDDYRVFLTARDQLAKTEDDSRIRLLRHPVKAELAWPKIPFLVVLGALFGSAMALVLDLSRSGGLRRLVLAKA